MTDGIRSFIAQRKQLILTNSKNIFANHFQTTQLLQPIFMTDSIRNFMYTKHNGGNAELRIYSFILQRQRIQPSFMTDSIRTFTHTKHTNNLNNQNNYINVGSTSKKKFMLLQLRQSKFLSIHIQTSQPSRHRT